MTARAIARLEVRRRGPRLRRCARRAAVGALCAGVLALAGGCSSIGAASGAAAGAATGLATANPAIGIGVGIAVQAAANDAVNTFMRNMHEDQQDRIAATVGMLPVGGTQTWRVKHRLPVENGHGEIRVTRAFSSPLAICKEFLFSVIDGKGPGSPEHWYTASACLDDGTWKWASAEPAVERWGTLQ
ncbi:hypothetical protein CY652_22820 [Burkholderia sp. WAC0059]|uniref:hypothetical protein n=1 Tax=Burkholderia sp. WAC0059 TaxID=2066022 RepID=UPI000C7F1346|nr:hypothetical protein [Burkholderia sp. WAC0059]PLZ00122.1 hypothetical protein CY652_22820 [Burkholderia sp. WAC0059]